MDQKEKEKLFRTYIELHAQKKLITDKIKELKPQIEENLQDSYTCNAGSMKRTQANKKTVYQPDADKVKLDIDKPEFKPQVVKDGLTPVFKLNKKGNQLLKDHNPEISKVAFYESIDKIEVTVNKDLVQGQEPLIKEGIQK